MKIKTVMLVLLMFFIGGCARTIEVTYRSDPPGAQAYYAGGNQREPIVLTYKPTDKDKARGFTMLQVPKMVWASGAYNRPPNIRANIKEGSEFNYTISRPNVPGRETDLAYALELEKMAIMRQQAQAQEDMSYDSNQMSNIMLMQTLKRSMNR